MSHPAASFIPVYRPSLGDSELKNVQEAVQSGWISSKGHFIPDFESGFARFIGTREGVATSSGTTALHLALAALGVGPGDEVIVPDLTFVAPINAVLYVGATPVLVDVEREGWGLDITGIEAAITPRTKGIVLVHLYGNPARVGPIREMCERRGFFLVEDGAEAHGATYGDRKVGSFGRVSCFSFYGNKILTTGEGGMCLTDDQQLADRMRMLRDHAMRPERRYWHAEVGFNYRMTNLQAAVGVAQLERLEASVRRKVEVARRYSELMSDKITVQRSPSWGQSVFWLFSVLAADGASRDRLARFLAERNVDSRPFFHPAHVMPPYTRFAGHQTFPVSDYLGPRGLNLPSYPDLTEEEILRVSNAVLDFLKG